MNIRVRVIWYVLGNEEQKPLLRLAQQTSQLIGSVSRCNADWLSGVRGPGSGPACVFHLRSSPAQISSKVALAVLIKSFFFFLIIMYWFRVCSLMVRQSYSLHSVPLDVPGTPTHKVLKDSFSCFTAHSGPRFVTLPLAMSTPSCTHAHPWLRGNINTVMT